MAAGRTGKTRQGGSGRAQKSRDTVRHEYDEDEAAQAYRDLLHEATATGDTSRDSDRPLKRRRIGKPSEALPAQDESVVRSSRHIEPAEATSHARRTTSPSPEHSQTGQRNITSQSSSGSEDESDVDWQGLLQPDGEQDQAEDQIQEPAAMAINLDEAKKASSSRRTPAKRLPASAAEKQKRVDASLKHFLPANVVELLRPSSEWTQFQHTRSIEQGLEQASNLWRGKFRVKRGGEWHTPTWSLDGDSCTADFDESASETWKDFFEAAKARQGSRDVGAQLFCALLRSVGVTARLVCSLQPLSFSKVPPTPTSTPFKPTYYLSETADRLGVDSPADDTDVSMPSVVSRASSVTSVRTPRPIRRFGKTQSRDSPQTDQGVAPSTLGKASPQQRRVTSSSYPVFWVEVFDSSMQTWYCVDPLVTRTWKKPQKLEPPLNDSSNSLTYVIAFDADGHAKDVTRRYAKAFNAKTRRSRVESTKSGEAWLGQALKAYMRRRPTNADQIEDAELARKEAQEPLPKNVQDFKDHPLFVMERHLRTNEVIHPKGVTHQVGKQKVGKNSDATEPIYRRQNVYMVKSDDKWFRTKGKHVKEGETPLKYSFDRKLATRRRLEEDDETDRDEDYKPLFAEYQTEPYVPPAVVDGQVPRNKYGNLDVYVPTMIPPGAAHVRSSDAKAAARIVGIDHAEAVNGFQFKGRGQKGTAVINGVIVAKESAEAVEAVIEGLQLDRETADRAKRSKLALAAWKKFLIGLRIRERVVGSAAEQTETTAEQEEGGNGSVAVDSEESASEYEDGGFLLEDDTPIPQPTGGSKGVKRRGQDVEASEAVRLINEDANNGAQASTSNRPKEWFKPTVYSPWDSVLAVKARQNTPEGLFEVTERGGNAGGFVEEDHAGGFMKTEENDAGGFVKTEENDAGGFVKDDDVNEKISVKGKERAIINEGNDLTGGNDETISTIDDTGHHVQGDGSGGFIRRDDKDSFMRDAGGSTATETSRSMALAVNDTTLLPDTATDAINQSMDIVPDTTQSIEEDPKAGTEASKAPQKVSPRSSTSDKRSDDAMSLLSHDPDDEELEPEWLAHEATLYSD
ncbi:MAG: hypothetical protein M1828_000739 [Chrysothrix sp. TS-e1954]|nr:MAG: hypothetical protein M1828_000739 [Chrysothrix sp. TS-e1954]